MRSRANARFISCPACRADAERYLFHERGARFVQCRSCGVVYVNPPAREVRDYFDVRSSAGVATIEDREHVRKELDDVLRYAPTCIAPTAVFARTRTGCRSHADDPSTARRPTSTPSG